MPVLSEYHRSTLISAETRCHKAMILAGSPKNVLKYGLPRSLAQPIYPWVQASTLPYLIWCKGWWSPTGASTISGQVLKNRYRLRRRGTPPFETPIARGHPPPGTSPPFTIIKRGARVKKMLIFYPQVFWLRIS